MIKQLKELLTEVEVNIDEIQDVGVKHTKITFSFKKDEKNFPENWSENFGKPEGLTHCDFCDNKVGAKCPTGREADVCIHYEKKEFDKKGNYVMPDVVLQDVPKGDILAMEKVHKGTETEKIIKKVNEIVKKSGIPKDKIIIGSSPKLEAPVLDLGVKPIIKETAQDKAIAKRFKERVKRLKDLGHILSKDKKQYGIGGVGLAVTYIESAEDSEFDRACKQYENIIAKKKKEADIVQQALAKSNAQTSITGQLTEQQEMIEEEYNAGTQFKGKPATPEEAFESPFEAPLPPPIKGMAEIAKNPMEQMKKNSGKPYLNKANVLMTPPKETEDDLSEGELWDNLLAKCKKNNISTDGMEQGDQTVEEILQLDKWVDETIAEEAAK